MKHTTITVWGSHGSLEVHALSGHIISRKVCDELECDCGREGTGYAPILWFDPARWDENAREHGLTDILHTAHLFRLPDGRVLYEREGSVIQHGDPECPDWYTEFPALLPAPSVAQAVPC